MAAMMISFVSLGAGIRISMSLSCIGCYSARMTGSQKRRSNPYPDPLFRSPDFAVPLPHRMRSQVPNGRPSLLLAIGLWLVWLYFRHPGAYSIVEMHCKRNCR